ncbi:MAG: galactokinase [Paludibacteraceae bacterium]|nr:galactokinase [Paludibacteraceae bacterium]
METKELKQAFEKTYGKQPQAIYFAPGRVNLIGEHTDYNGGYVFPCALSFGTYLLLAENTDNKLRFQSLNISENVEVSVSDIHPLSNRCWANYPLGCIAQYINRGFQLTKGYDLLFWGNVPAGAGLSSSAAIEVVTACAFNDVLDAGYDKTEFAKIGQLSEHEYAGVNCGIMDQFASAQGKKDHAIFLNCQTLEFQLVPVKLDGIKVVIANTHSPHKLDSGTYNDRVKESREALAKKDYTNPRARHFISEVKRTTDAVEALQKGDIATFGQLMNQSHVSLRDDYEVTGPELDAMAEAAWKIDGVIGSRMTGGGFGGCTVSLVKDEAIPTFIEQVGKEYKAKTGLTAEFYVAEIGDGVKKIDD